MRILIDIGHPAHVHLFKNFAHEMERKGHRLLFTCRDKEFEIALLEKNKFDYVSFGKKYKSTLGKVWGLLKFDYKEWSVCLKFKPDVLLSHGSIYAAHASWIINKPHIAFEDTFNFEQIKLYKPFTDTILTSWYDNPLMNDKKTTRYKGYHELAYLHPNHFIPDKSVLDELGVAENDKYVIVRFVSWNASHDIGHKGITFENKLKAIAAFEKYAKVFISSESDLPNALKKYQLKIAPHRMHDALAYASLVWGESFTVPAECSILGVPSIINHNTCSLYLKQQEKEYGLCFNYSESLDDQEKAINKGVELLKMEKKELRNEWRKRGDKLLSEKIDVTGFLVWFIENYPRSEQIMKENPDYQYNFK